MANAFLSFEDFDCCGVDQYAHHLHHGCEKEGIINQGTSETSLFGREDWEELDNLCSQYGFYQEENIPKEVHLSKDHHQQQTLTPFSDCDMMDDFQFNMVSPSPFQTPQEIDILDQPKENPQLSSLASVELLKSAFKRMNDERLNEKSSEKACSTSTDFQRVLSTEEVMRVAGAWLLQFCEKKDDDLSMLMYPFGCALSGLTGEEIKDIELAQLLIASAEKVGNQQFDRASKWLSQCDYLSSSTGTPVQRVVYYFAQALRDRINSETRRIPLKDFLESRNNLADVEEAMLSPNSALLASHQLLPFSKVLQFAGMQAIIDNVDSAKRVHLIEIGITIGLECVVLMQALASRSGLPLEHLKLTIVITRSQEKIEETGKRLASFAESMNIPFSFNVVVVSDMKHLEKDLFVLEDSEVVAIYGPFVLRTMIQWSDHLESLIRVIESLHPCIMVIIEVEGNHNSPSFVNRFIEALFFYSAYFDCLEDCMERDHQDRITLERNYFGKAILNIVAKEGEERIVRHVGIDMWRAFFSRFGLVEAELSYSSMYQASLVSKKFACSSSCTLDLNGKSLTIGWKGTPIHSLSTWKFHNL